MINDEAVYKIGYISKPHGLRGEVVFRFSDDIFDTTESEYLIVRVDGILVPFFIEELRFRSDNSALVKFEGIDSSDKAQMLVGCDVCFERDKAAQSESNELTLSYFIGFTVKDTKGTVIGTITDIDDQTENWLFKVDTESGKTHFIPAHDEFIEDIGHDSKTLVMSIPDGLLSI